MGSPWFDIIMSVFVFTFKSLFVARVKTTTTPRIEHAVEMRIGASGRDGATFQIEHDLLKALILLTTRMLGTRIGGEKSSKGRQDQSCEQNKVIHCCVAESIQKMEMMFQWNGL